MPTKTSEALVLTSKQNGIVVIPMGTELTRLNYFDGKFLRASDLKAEQDYLRHLVQESNRAGGAGVAHGFDLTLGAGDKLNVGPGLAIDADGRVLLMPQGTSIGIQDLIDKSRELEKLSGNSAETGGSFAECAEVSSAPPVNVTNPDNIYKIVICAAEALCGEEDVYGKLCEEACSTTTDRPFIIEGVVIRAIPLGVAPTTKGQLTQTNLRSRTAAAYFEFERNRVSNLISANGLKQPIWCLGANAEPDGCVPIGVIARSGSSTVFLDPWIVRRELIDTPARRYWQWRMMMRPWDVFLAHILQFQCQLRDLYKNFPDPGTGPGPCSEATDAINEASVAIAEIYKYYEATAAQLAQFNAKFDPFAGGGDRLLNLNKKLDAIHKTLSTMPADRWLINGGIIELPSAGYLPVVPGGNVSVNQQVQKMMGEGVDLRFCVVRPDYVAHALEEAQHMERISLIEGLEDARKKPEVDILVPEGELVTPTPEPSTLRGFEVEAEFRGEMQSVGESTNPVTTTLPVVKVLGAARYETLSSGGGVFYLSCGSKSLFVPGLRGGLSKEQWLNLSKTMVPMSTGEPPLGVWITLKSDVDLLKAKVNDQVNVNAEVLVAAQNPNGLNLMEFTGSVEGQLTVKGLQPDITGEGSLKCLVEWPEASIPPQQQTEVYEHRTQVQGDWIYLGVMPQKNKNFTLIVNRREDMKLDVGATIVTAPNRVFTILLRSALNEDADVFSEANSFHGEALQGLKAVSKAMNDSVFEAEKAKLLFPPAPAKPASGQPSVRATRDWVLFHRRRTKQCEEAKRSRRYQVYQFAVTPRALRELSAKGDTVAPRRPPTKTELEGLTAAEVAQFKAIGEVSFVAGTATFEGDQTTLKNAWTKIKEGQILWGAIGSRGDAANDGETLSRNRLTALESVLDKVSPNARADVLPIVPPPLEDPNFDGVILLINGIVLPGYYYDYYGYYGGSGLAVGIGARNLKP